LGKKPVVYCNDELPKNFLFLDGFVHVQAGLPSDADFEMTVFLDVPSESLLPAGLPIDVARGTVFVIDHHACRVPFGDVEIVDEVSSVGELIVNIRRFLRWPIDKEIANCLYTAIVTDTGSFRHSNTTADTHNAAADLIDVGARPGIVSTALFESYSLGHQKLLAAVLQTLWVHEEVHFAAMHCTPRMLFDSGATESDLAGMINYALGIDTVEVAALFRVEALDRVRVSLRSKGDFDVADLAAKYGGGGHRQAAGCILTGVGLSTHRSVILEAVEEILTKRRSKK
jgi:phosphoesterase RecJ-like protein